YEYASRINRFHNPIGVGYYDSYYTNMYTYTGNPAFYGTSIYSGYGWGMPSQQFGVMSFGVSSCWGCGGGMAYGSSFYDPWCGCNRFGNNWGYGSGFGYGSYWGYGGGWGYGN